MRISLRRLAMLCLLSFTATCVDSPTGPGGSGPATFAITPVFSQSATRAKAMYSAAGLQVDQVRLLITRPPTVVVKDTVVDYDGQSELTLDLHVVAPVGERLSARLDYLSGSVVLYSGTTMVTTVSPLTPASQVPQATILIEPVGPGFNAASVTLDPSGGTFPTTALISFTAKAFSAAQAEIAGALFAWSVDDETVGTIDGAGVLTPTAKGGSIRIRATTLNGTFAEASIALKSPPASLSLVSGGGQTAAAGTQLAPIVVKVADANGNGIPGEVITFAVATGGGSIVVNNGTTDAGGLARVTWTLGSTAGAQSITAIRAGLTGSPLTITATATTIEATKLGFLVQPATAVAGANIAPAIQVAALDASGNPVTSFTGTITIALATNPGNATLGGTLTVVAVAGVATFNNLTLNASGAGYTLAATTAGLTGATSASFNATAGTPTALVFITQPSNTLQGSAIDPPVAVKVVNNFGALITTATNIVTIALGSNPGGSTLGGNPNAAALFGIASFSTLTLNNVGVGYTLTASATGLATATSTAFDVVAPAAATRAWTGATSTAWTDPSNWNPAGVPTVADSVVIPSGGAFSPAIASNVSVAAIVVHSGAVLNVGAFQVFPLPGKITNQGTLNLNGSIVLAAIDNQGVLVAQGSVAAAGAVSNANGATLRVQGTSVLGSGGFVASGGLTNSGVIELTDVGGGFGATLAGGTITNTAAGTVTALQGANGARAISGALVNQGTVMISTTAGLSLVQAGVSSSNTGTINVSGGNFSTLSSGPTDVFTNSGTITITAPRKWTVTGGSLHLGSGAVAGTGTLDLAGVTIANFATAAVTSLISADAATAFPGNVITIASGEQLRMAGGTLSAGVSVQSGGTYIAQGTVTQAGALSLAAGSTLRVQGISGFNSTLTVSNGFTNNGLIELTDIAGGTASSLVVTAGSLVNASGGTINALQGSGSGARTLQAQLDNQGIISMVGSQALNITRSGATHTNSGTITLTSGNLTVTQSGATPSFTNTGTITVPGGRIMTISGGAANLAGGFVSGAGLLDLTSVVADFTTASMTAVLTTNATTSLVGGTLAIPVGQQLTMQSASFSPAIALSGTLISQRVSSISGALTVNAGSTLRVLGTSGFNSTLTVANGFTNNGTIELTDNGTTASTLNVTTGALTNAGTLSVLQGAGSGARTLGAELVNQAPITLTNTQGLTLSKAGAAHSNASTITLTSGNLTVTQSGAGASFTNTGAVAIGAGRTWTVSGGALNLAGGTTTGPGTLSLTGATVDFTTATMTAPLTTDIATTVVGGTVTIPAGETLTLLNATLSAGVTLNEGTLVAQRASSVAGALTVNVGSTLRVQGTSGFNASLTVANGFTNNGTIELTDNGTTAATLAVTTGALTNAGTFSVLQGAGSGARTLSAELVNQAPITLTNTQGLTINKAGAAHTNGSTITLTNGNLTVTQSGAGASFTNTGTVTIGTGRTWAVTGGALNLTGGTTSGLGTLNLSGVTVDFTTASMTAPLTTDITTTVVGGTVTVPTSETLTLLNAALSAAVTLNQGTLVAQRTSSIAGAMTMNPGSTLRVQGTSGFNAILTVANGFTNNGTVELTDNGTTAATLAITSGALTNAGTFAVLQGAGSGARTLAAQLVNQAPITLTNTQGLTINKAGAAHTNSSTITLISGNLTLVQSGTGASFTNTGAVAIGSGRTWTVTGGALNLTGGTTSGLGTLDLNGTLVDFTTASMTTPLTTDNATTVVGNSVSIPTGQTLTLLNAVFNAAVVLNQGTLVSQRSTNIGGSLTVNPGSILRVQGTSGFNSTLTVVDGFTNNGTIELTDNGTTAATLAVTNGSLTNAGTLSVLQGAGSGARTIAAQLVNQSPITLTNTQGLTLSKAGAAHTNTSTITLTNGNFSVTQAGGASFTNTGTVAIGAGRTWSVTGGALNLAGGTTSGLGTLDLSGVALDFTTASMTTPLTTDIATTIVGGGVTIPTGQTLTLLNAAFSGAVTLNQGTLVAQRASSIAGPVAVNAGSTLRVQGTSGFNGSLTVANGFTNNGTVELTDNGTTAATLSVTSGALTNAAGATFSVLQGAGNGARTLNAGLVNQGTITINNTQGITIAGQFDNSGAFNISGNQTVLISKAGAAHTNTGTITLPSITSGTLNIGANAVAQTFTNSGTISVGAGRTLGLLGNTAFTNAAGGTYTGPSGGTLSVASTSTFTNNGTIAPGGINAAGIMTYNGAWNPGVGGTLSLELASTTSNDRLIINGAATLGGTLTALPISGYVPSGSGATNHDIMTFASQTGTFGTINKPAVCGTPTVVTGTIYRLTC
jgi:hypothetical protein